MKNKVNILGTEYSICLKAESEDRKLENYDGYCDFSTKTIVVCNKRGESNLRVDNVDYIINKCARHEMVHAFLMESGLSVNSWADNEELVDWIAIQFPKMREAFDDVFSEE